MDAAVSTEICVVEDLVIFVSIGKLSFQCREGLEFVQHIFDLCCTDNGCEMFMPDGICKNCDLFSSIPVFIQRCDNRMKL